MECTLVYREKFDPKFLEKKRLIFCNMAWPLYKLGNEGFGQSMAPLILILSYNRLVLTFSRETGRSFICPRLYDSQSLH